MSMLKDFKVPNFKFPKMKMKGIEEIEEVKLDYEKMEKVNDKASKKNYPGTNYQTIKEIFLESTEKYKDKEFVLEKYDHKGKYTEISWSKDNNSTNTILKDKEGNIVPLSSGKTIWHIIDNNTEVSFN